VLCRIYDWDEDGSPDYVGEFECTLGELRESEGKRFTVINKQKQAKNPKKYKSSGTVFVEKVVVAKFLDVQMLEHKKEARQMRFNNAGALLFNEARLFISRDDMDRASEWALEAADVQYENFGYMGDIKRAAYLDFLQNGPDGKLQRLHNTLNKGNAVTKRDVKEFKVDARAKNKKSKSLTATEMDARKKMSKESRDQVHADEKDARKKKVGGASVCFA
jgi:hypothetical protein